MLIQLLGLFVALALICCVAWSFYHRNYGKQNSQTHTPGENAINIACFLLLLALLIVDLWLFAAVLFEL